MNGFQLVKQTGIDDWNKIENASQIQTWIAHMSTAAQCTWLRLWHVFHLEPSNWIQPAYKLDNLKMNVALKGLHIRLYVNNLIWGKDAFDLFDNIVVLIRAYRFLPQFCVDPFSQFSSICSNLQYSCFMTPLGIHTSHRSPCAVTIAKDSTDLAASTA